MRDNEARTHGNLYIGVMSGTSIDALDVALTRIDQTHFSLLHTLSAKIPTALQTALHHACESPTFDMTELGDLHTTLANFIAAQVNKLLEECNLTPQDITAIGSHGQTLFHYPVPEHGFSLQIGDGNLIAQLTGIATVTDFRMADMAAGGQGAPLAPGFHNAVFRSSNTDRFIVNLGGISNVTWLPQKASEPVIGFDIGPANTLLDAWTRKHRQRPFDLDGEWARSGQVDADLLEQMLCEPYFARTPPKSTGRELFNENWLNKILAAHGEIKTVDVQRTLLELTAQSTAQALKHLASMNKLENPQVYCCGGGAYNTFLMSRLNALLEPWTVNQTAQLGVEAEWVEAAAFAWLAFRRTALLPGNLPSVTGASKEKILGALYLP